MLYIAISFIIVTVILACMFVWACFLSKNKKQKESNRIISQFEPDNISPKLTEMIEFHKKNGTVEYEI